MSTIKIFKDSSGLLNFNGSLIPSNLIAIQVINLTTIHIHPLNDAILNFWYEPVGKTYTISEILNESDIAYADLATFLAEVKDFFSSTDFTTLISAVQNSGGTTLKAFTVNTFERPANTNVYTAGDVVADVSDAFKPFVGVAKSNGTGVKISRVRLQTNDTGVAGKKFNIHLYKEAPTFIADNSPFSINYTDATKRLGVFPIVMGVGTMGTVGMNDYNQIICNPTARDIYYIIETVDGFTPSANSTKFQIAIDCELSNN